MKSRESGFARMLQSDAVIWFQRYQRSDLKRGSISLARQIGTSGTFGEVLVFISNDASLTFVSIL
jgi:hypothetical protein